MRLTDGAKLALVEAFVQGLSAYEQRHHDGACIDSRERFYRLMRAVCALHTRVTCFTWVTACHVSRHGSRDCMRGWAAARAVAVVGIAEEGGRVHLAPLPPEIAADLLPLLRERTAIGGVYRMHENQGFATLPVRGEHVVVHRNSRAPLAMNAIESFWEYTRERLHTFRKIQCRFLHLYLGEMCFRFNHRDADLAELLRTLLQSTSSGEARAVLYDVPANRQASS